MLARHLILIAGITSAATASANEIPPEESAIWTVDGCAAVLAQVRDSATGNPVPGARIGIVPRGVESRGEPALRSPDLRRIGRTTPEGTFVLAAPGAQRMVVEMPGFDVVEVETPCSDAITVLEITLQPLSPMRVPEAAAGGDAHRRLGGETLESMAGAPRNLFQAVQTVPGVARPTFGGSLLGSILGSGDLAVRGSRPGESRTYLDGIEIPYFYHYLGLSSVVPAEMIEQVDFVPGGAGPQFGRLTGGVLDIHSRALRSEEESDEPWHGRANLTFFEANAIARGPIGKKGYFSISDRFSIMDLFYKANPGGWGNGMPVWSYNDLQAVYKTPLAPGQELSVIAFGTFDDVIQVGTDTQLHTEFYRAGVSWRSRTESTKLQVATSYGYERFMMRLVQPGDGIQLASHRTQHDLRLASDGEIRFRKEIALRAGVEGHALRPEAGLALDWEQQEWAIIDRTYWDRGLWSAAWTELELRPIERVVVIPGVRYDYDTFVKRGWVDPRLTARVFVGEATVVSASGGLYHRPQPFSLAFADDRNLGLTSATQVSAGVEHRFGPGLVADVRGFRNEFHDQVQGIEWLPDFDEYGNSTLGDGQSYGVETFTRFSSSNGRTRGEAGFTWSRTEWRNKWPHQNPMSTEGTWTASDMDSTYAFTLVMHRELRKNKTFGLRARWYSGLPFTSYEADVYVPDDGGYIGIGRSPWAQRAPSYFQLDIRFAKRWSLGPRMGMEAFLDVQNVTARANVDRLNADGGKPTDPAVSGAMPFFPSLGMSLTF